MNWFRKRKTLIIVFDCDRIQIDSVLKLSEFLEQRRIDVFTFPVTDLGTELFRLFRVDDIPVEDTDRLCNMLASLADSKPSTAETKSA